MKQVIAVIVTYNRKELLEGSVIALINQNFKNCKILIVDNHSNDGTYEYIKKYLKKDEIMYIDTGSNLGGAGGFNFGIKEACKYECDYIWVMDDDCIVHKDTLQKFLEADTKLNGEYGFLSSKVLWKDNSLCTMNIQRETLTKNVKNFDKELINVCMASFVSLFLKKSTVLNVGLPFKEFFIWTDDWEYTRRISRKFKCYLVNNSVVTHKSKSNIGASISKDSIERLDRYNYLYRNDVYLYKREGIKGIAYLIPRLLIHIIRILKNSKIGKIKKIKILVTATIKGFKFNPDIEFIEDNPKVILQLFGEPISNGGQESFIMNMYRNIDRKRIQFDFYTPYYCNNQKIKDEIEKLGGNIFCGDGKFSDEKGNKKDFKKNLKKFFENTKYKVVHIHSGSSFALMEGAKIAKKAGIDKVIVHSHCSGIDNFKHKIVKKLSNLYFNKYVDEYCACSKIAANWKFDKSKAENCKIINNAIDTNKFYFDKEIRRNMRKKYNFENKLIVGHIGRFSPQKNHEFLIKIFKEIKEEKDNAILILIGIGELQDEIKEEVKKFKLDNSVVFLNIRSDINEWLNCMDVFLLPSLYEGLPVVGVEAQATGLPVVTSDKVTKELPIQKLVKYISLDDNTKYWARQVIEIAKTNRENMSKEIINKNFDVKIVANDLTKFYSRL